LRLGKPVTVWEGSSRDAFLVELLLSATAPPAPPATTAIPNPPPPATAAIPQPPRTCQSSHPPTVPPPPPATAATPHPCPPTCHSSRRSSGLSRNCAPATASPAIGRPVWTNSNALSASSPNTWRFEKISKSSNRGLLVGALWARSGPASGLAAAAAARGRRRPRPAAWALARQTPQTRARTHGSPKPSQLHADGGPKPTLVWHPVRTCQKSCTSRARPMT
jgi:hypothetical protein